MLSGDIIARLDFKDDKRDELIGRFTSEDIKDGLVFLLYGEYICTFPKSAFDVKSLFLNKSDINNAGFSEEYIRNILAEMNYTIYEC